MTSQVNCLHEIFFEAALADAKELDAYYAEHKRTKGPLHGVPVSLKDQFHVKDVETTMGYVGWINTFEGKKGDARFKTYESEMVRELRDLGAILYCKTSVPHTLMAGETVNNIIEYTWNPKNRYLAAGGSSGGEGALIGLKGSPIGVGTDIGGSIRIPAAFNGLYGIRPSGGRLPYEGMANSMDGQNSILSVVGPLGTTARSVKLIVQSLLSQKPWLYDPLVVEIPWREEQYQSVWNTVNNSLGQLTFGIMRTDNIVNPQPPVARAVDIVAKAVAKAGHQVITWQSPSYAEGLRIIYNTWLFDGGKDVHGAFALSGEPIAEQVVMSYGKEPREEKSASYIAQNNVEQRNWKKQYMDAWNATASETETGQPIDCIIAPLAPYPAPRPGRYKWYGYSSFVNGLDYTSVVVPVTLADKDVDKYEDGYKPISDQDKEAFHSYDAEIYDGAHVSIQLIGRRLQEEKMLALAEYVGQIIGTSKLK